MLTNKNYSDHTSSKKVIKKEKKKNPLFNLKSKYFFESEYISLDCSISNKVHFKKYQKKKKIKVLSKKILYKNSSNMNKSNILILEENKINGKINKAKIPKYKKEKFESMKIQEKNLNENLNINAIENKVFNDEITTNIINYSNDSGYLCDEKSSLRNQRLHSIKESFRSSKKDMLFKHSNVKLILPLKASYDNLPEEVKYFTKEKQTEKKHFSDNELNIKFNRSKFYERVSEKNSPINNRYIFNLKQNIDNQIKYKKRRKTVPFSSHKTFYNAIKNFEKKKYDEDLCIRKSNLISSNNINNEIKLNKKKSNKILSQINTKEDYNINFKNINHNTTNINNINENNLSCFKTNNFKDKAQIINSFSSSLSSCSFSSSSFSTVKNISDEEKKKEKKNKKIVYDKSKFTFKTTNKNLRFLNKFESHKYEKSILEKIEKKTDEYYSYLNEFTNPSLKNEYSYEHRIFELDKYKLNDIFSNHIILIGYQDSLDKFVKLITNHFPNKYICFLGTEEHKFDVCNKILKQYKNIYYFQGDPTNPFHLLNSGLNNAFHVIILSQNIFKKLNEDMNLLLSSSIIDYYFDINMTIELWNSKSCSLLGYKPLDKNAKEISNEFYHPLFMSGKILYLSHFDKLTSMSVTDPLIIESLHQIISVGFRNDLRDIMTRTDIGICRGAVVPILITIDLVEKYWGKEYHILVQDLLKLEKPALPLGVYVSDPLSYHLLDSKGNIFHSKKTPFWKIVNSHKRKLINLESMGRFESAYFDNMKFIRDISYTDKIILNCVDLKKTHLPIFITNPLPGFILTKNCKILIMTNSSSGVKLNNNHIKTETDNEEWKIIKKKIFIEKKLKNKNLINKNEKDSNYEDILLNEKIRECQENYIKTLEKLNKVFTKNYLDALKNAGKLKKQKTN